MTDQILEITDDTFIEQVLCSDKPVLVDFHAEWCGPCKMMAPVVTELAGDYVGRATVAKLDIDKNPQVANHYGIRSIPTMMLFKDGEVRETVQGAVPRSKLESVIARHLL